MSAPSRIRRTLLIAPLALAMLIDQAPAALLANAVKEASHGRAQLGEPHGTLWHGGAHLLALDSEQRARRITRLSWHWQASALRHGELAWQLNFDGQGSATLHLSPAGLRLTNGSLEIPATALEPWLAGPLPISGLSGGMRLALPQWQCQWQDSSCAGQAELTWSAARIASVSATTLGSYVTTLERATPEAAWRYRLLTLNGLVTLQLSGEADGRFASLTGTARADPEAPAQLRQWLLALGPRPGNTTQVKLNIPLALKVSPGGTAPHKETPP